MNPYSDLVPRLVHSYTFHENIDIEFSIINKKQLYEIGCINKYKRADKISYFTVIDSFSSPYYKSYSKTRINYETNNQTPITRISLFYNTTNHTTLLNVEIFVTRYGDDLGNDFSLQVFPKEKHTELSMLIESTIRQCRNESIIINSILINRPIHLVCDYLRNQTEIVKHWLSQDYKITENSLISDDFENMVECVNNKTGLVLRYKWIKTQWNSDESSLVMWFEKTRNDKPAMNNIMIISWLSLSEVSCYLELKSKQWVYWNEGERETLNHYNENLLIFLQKQLEKLTLFPE